LHCGSRYLLNPVPAIQSLIAFSYSYGFKNAYFFLRRVFSVIPVLVWLDKGTNVLEYANGKRANIFGRMK
jgi:hypothetical protein